MADEWERQSLAGASSVLMVLSGLLTDAVAAASSAINGGVRSGNDLRACPGFAGAVDGGTGRRRCRACRSPWPNRPCT